MTNSFREPSADELKLEWPSDDPVDERDAMTLFDQDHPTDAAAAAPQPDLYDQLTEDALARDARPSSFFDQERLPPDDDGSTVGADRLWGDPSDGVFPPSARKRGRRRRLLVAVVAAISVPLGVGAGLSLAPSDESGDKAAPAEAEKPTRPAFGGTVRLPRIPVEPVAAIAPLPEPAPAAAPSGAPTTSFTVPSPAPGGAPPTTTAAAAAQPPAPSQPAPPPTTTAAPPPSAPASNPNPVCSVLPVLCQ